MTEFGAVDVNALREGRTETFHAKDGFESGHPDTIRGSRGGRQGYETI
jgi:hypothetical protein